MKFTLFVYISGLPFVLCTESGARTWICHLSRFAFLRDLYSSKVIVQTFKICIMVLCIFLFFRKAHFPPFLAQSTFSPFFSISAFFSFFFFFWGTSAFFFLNRKEKHFVVYGLAWPNSTNHTSALRQPWAVFLLTIFVAGLNDLFDGGTMS